MSKTRVAVCGAAGRMGREVVRAVLGADDMELVAAIDGVGTGADAGELAGCGPTGVLLRADLSEALATSGAEVMVDFTVPASAHANAVAAIGAGVAPVIGTTGLGDDAVADIGSRLAERGLGGLLAPNFAIGAVLMMRFAAEAARYMPDAEVIELHHERKLDAPSGTAMMTARLISEARGDGSAPEPAGAFEKAAGARGGDVQGIRVHSVRLQGHVAHQEVIFGALGQTLTIRHDSIDRTSFMPGVLLAVRRVRELAGLALGLDSLL